VRVTIELQPYYEPVQSNQAAASKMLLSLPSRSLGRATTPNGQFRRGCFHRANPYPYFVWI
jgi:hypothetical protein